MPSRAGPAVGADNQAPRSPLVLLKQGTVATGELILLQLSVPLPPSLKTSSFLKEGFGQEQTVLGHLCAPARAATPGCGFP